MQNVSQDSSVGKAKIEKVNVQYDIRTSSTPRSTSNSSLAKSETETYSERRRYMSDSSESEEDSVSEVESFMIDQEFEEDPAAKFLLNPDEDRAVDPETQARLEALLQAAGIGQLAAKDGKHLADPEVLRRLTSSVSCALDEAAAALTRMRTDNPRCSQADKASLVEACTDGDVRTVQKLLTEGGRSVHETSEEGESLLSLACSAGYFELAQVLLAMHANVEDRGIKGECTPLMEAASAGHIEIVRLLVAHGADVNAQSTSGNTPLMYGCAGGHTEVVKFLLEHGANVEDHNENGHTPLMEAASAGHVGLAKLLLAHGAGINTHSNEFKESALTLACYKGHLDMVRFLLEAGADQEHKTDEMHTALMEASMDGHVEVARLLLDSGAQVNMPTDSFESPLTLAACGGHVDLAMLLIERGANIEEVNDEGYTPLMEAAREGHEEMVHLLLGQGANINAQTDETQETALTLACCGGFTDVADILLKGGANIELGASTPLMEAAQEGHLDLVKFLLLHGANVEAQTQTGDTALTYACENGHTDVADLLLQYGANLEHESEGGRTPLMKACRAGHLCTVQFLISKGANVRKQTTNNDHTPLSLACAGGHLAVVELLLSQNADPNHKLKDNSTMLIEAAKGGHTNVVQLLLDFPHSIQSLALNQHQVSGSTSNLTLPTAQISNREQPSGQSIPQNIPAQSVNFFQQPTGSVLQEVPEAVRIIQQQEFNLSSETNKQKVAGQNRNQEPLSGKKSGKPSLLPKSQSTGTVFESNLTSAEAQQVRSQPLEFEDDIFSSTAAMEFLHKEDQNSTLIEFIKNRKKHFNGEEGSSQKQQILEELHKVERELHGKQQPSVFQYSQDQFTTSSANLPNITSIDLGMQQQQGSTACLQSPTFKLAVGDSALNSNPIQPSFYFTPMSSPVTVSLNTATTSTANQPVKFSSIAHSEVKETTAVSDRPKAKPAKKEGKSVRKQQQLSIQPNVYTQQLPLQQQGNQFVSAPTLPQVEVQQPTVQKPAQFSLQTITGIDLDNLDQESLVLKEENSENLITASILQQFQNTSLRTFVDSNKSRIEYSTTSQGNDSKAQILNKEYSSVEEVVRSLDPFTSESGEQSLAQHGLQVQPYPSSLEESMIASITTQQDLSPPTDLSRVEYFVQSNGTQLPMHPLYPYEHYLTAPGVPNKGESGAIYQAGFQAGINLMSQHLACPSVTGAEQLTPVNTVTPSVGTISVSPTQQYVNSSKQLPLQLQTPSHLNGSQIQSVHHYQIQHQQQIIQGQLQQVGQVQAATQTSQTPNVNLDTSRKQPKTSTNDNVKTKKGRMGRHPNQLGNNFQQNQTYQIDPNSAITQYNNANNQQPCPNPIVAPSLDVDSETESNHDTALTLACAGGHEELVELLLNRGADIEHRDKKGFTPLILAATAGHEKVVEILMNHSADIEAQSERTKDTPLSLACSGGRYEVVDMLLKRNANKEHRNVSDYTPLSLAASGGYVNIIKLLLNHGAEINSRTGSKLGISPLMLAAMNGHTAAVKLLLDMGSDINAQIETNRNTALTLACFQGRHEVVSLLLDRKANVEHRAKTGLTPLMEAASGGYVEVGRVLLDKGADVNATPVPSSRDTALTIAADKGHVRFVELLLCRGALVEVKNKKGNSPLWLAANGGHLAVVELLYNVNADIDSQDNRKVSCLMAAFRKGHVKVVKWMVHSVTQFPSEQEMMRYLSTISDKDIMDKCHECIAIIQAAKETQAAKANKNASILLEELDMERTREESKKLAAARRRERKKKKKLEKKEEKRKLLEENKKNENYADKVETDKTEEKEDEESPVESAGRTVEVGDKEEGDSGIDANSQGSCSSNDIKSKDKRKDKKKKKNTSNVKGGSSMRQNPNKQQTSYEQSSEKNEKTNEKQNQNIRKNPTFEGKSPADRDDFEATGNEYVSSNKLKKGQSHDDHSPKNTSPKQNSKREEGWKEVVRKSSVQTVSTNEAGIKKVSVPLNAISRVIGRGGSNINAIRGSTGAHIEVEKQSKGQGERIITLKGSADAIKLSQTLIATLIKDPEVDIMQMLPKAVKTNPPATTLWDKTQIGTKKATGKAIAQPSSSQKIEKVVPTNITANTGSVPKSVSSVVNKNKSSFIVTNTRNTAPRLMAQAEKNATQSSSSNKPSLQNQPNPVARTSNKSIALSQSFAAKLTDASAAPSVAIAHSSMKPVLNMQHNSSDSVSPKIQRMPASIPHTSPIKQNRPEPTASAPPMMQHFQSPRKAPLVPSSTQMTLVTMSSNDVSAVGGSGDHGRSTTPIKKPATQISHNEESHSVSSSVSARLEYTLFNSGDQQPMWRRGDNESQKPVNFAAATGNSNMQASSTGSKFMAQDLPLQVDAAKAPGYRGGSTSSPISSKNNSNSTTPPNIAGPSYSQYHEPQKAQHMSHMANTILRPQPSQNNLPSEMQATSNYYGELFNQGAAVSSISNPVPNIGKDAHLISSYNQTQTSSGRNQNYSQSSQPTVSMSRLNPKAPDFSSSLYSVSNKLLHQQQSQLQQSQLFNAYSMDNSAPMHFVPKGNIDGYHRSNMVQTNQMPLLPLQSTLTQQQTEMISGMATGLTLHNIARATGSEILEGPADLGLMNNSPNMSPNMSPLQTSENTYLDDRKPMQPPPIGTERARRNYNSNLESSNWMMGNDKNQPRWVTHNLDRMNMRVMDQPMADTYSHGMQLDNTPNYSSTSTMPPFLQMTNARSMDFVPPTWDANSRQNLLDDNQVWAMSDWKQ
ncbi:ankyrin repeat domain-containing protein 17-like isoform X2 [Harmonia axyridis]|uniref:ankyrin repeat domain-containing protein 17-like isoform X2 n=1 Tax=Harmonia axyridis TaxID=115357 RepID=UPI001E27715D|nr:ankyrin repeat domain-containing protein 17-like isoform X2 [Harmonia axyridis]